MVRISKEYKGLQEKREGRFSIAYDKHRNNIEKRKKMSVIAVDTISFKFNRDEAHER